MGEDTAKQLLECCSVCLCVCARNTVVCTPASVHLLLCLSAASLQPRSHLSIFGWHVKEIPLQTGLFAFCTLSLATVVSEEEEGKGRGGGAECEKNVQIPPCVGV